MNIDPGASRPGLVAMRVGGFALDPQSGEPVILLTDASGERVLSMGIGRLEATSIVIAMEKTPTPRPLTHELMKSILDSTGTRVVRVIIHDVRNRTFHARVELDTDGGAVSLDARPSDGIALAVRTGAPIYASEHVVTRAGNAKKSEAEQSLEAFIENLKPSDFLDR